MDYTVEFDSELLKQFPQEEHFMYKEAISHKVTEYLEHNFFRIKPVRTRSAKGIYEMKVLSLIHISEPRDPKTSRMPSSA